ncbi:MAG: conjugal transfer protein TraF [Gammaproteobacteria bacterium]|nr:conjugal transfer protein TraF [Gammaproteobacteria bacterium]
MNVIKSGFYAAALAVVSQSVLAASFAYEARSLGMGNIGVATADIATAPFANPAMLSFQKDDDDFSLLVGLGGYFNDNDGMIENIDRFQSAESANDTNTMLWEAQQLDGKVIAPELSTVLAIGFSGETYSMSVSARTDVIVAGGVTNVATDVAQVVDPAFDILNIVGAKTTEVGFSISRDFEFMDRKVSIGVTPKMVSVEAVGYVESVITANTGLSDLVDNAVQDLGSFTTFDIGAVMAVTENIQVGLVAKNMITEDMSFLTTSGGTADLSFDTQLKIGVAYASNFLTIGADLDLIENDSVLSGGAFSGLKRQNLSMGLEVDFFDFLQLRLGMIKNIAGELSGDDKKVITTAGIGLWLGFNLDIAVMAGAGDSLGAFVQTGFKF